MTLTDLLKKKMADYTKEQLEEAKEYLRRRLENESSMRDDIGDVLSFYIMLLVMLLVSGESEERINETLDELVMMILEDCDTLAAFILDRLGRIPQPGERPVVNVDHITLTVSEIEDRRIAKVLIVKNK